MSTINVQSDDDHALKCMKKFQDFSFLTPRTLSSYFCQLYIRFYYTALQKTCKSQVDNVKKNGLGVRSDFQMEKDISDFSIINLFPFLQS